MKKRIQDIAKVRSGIYMTEVPDGEIACLQVSDFDRKLNQFITPAPSLALNSRTKNHLLTKGDLILAAKGNYNFCTVFSKKMGKMVASSAFLVIQIQDKTMISPDYLCWILNREDTQAFLKANAIGTSMPSIGKTLIEALEVNIPLIDIQNKIVQIAGLQQREQQLHEEISSLRHQLIHYKLYKSTKL